MRVPSYRTISQAFVALACLLGDAGCGSKLPPSLPSTDAHLRFASRIELVGLVISDRVRAEKVRGLYTQIEKLMIDVNVTTATEVSKLGAENYARTEAETRAVVATVRDADIAAFRRYAKLQLELRRSMNAEEFAKLDAIK